MCSRSKVEIFPLRRTIFDITRSYAEFVLISKEISVLENEMLELKESLAEWKSMPSLLHIDESASAVGASSSTFYFLILP
jgi:hypothetical protein